VIRVNTTSDPTQIVLEAFEAVESRDAQRLASLYHPDVEFHWPPSLSTEQLGQTWEEVWDPLQPTPRERAMSPRLIASSDHEAVVLWHQRGLSPDGRSLDVEVLGLYEVRDGKFFRAQMFYFDTAEVVRYLEETRPDGRAQTAGAP
jgi:ketosteroid isomerase-like protein